MNRKELIKDVLESYKIKDAEEIAERVIEALDSYEEEEKLKNLNEAIRQLKEEIASIKDGTVTPPSVLMVGDIEYRDDKIRNYMNPHIHNPSDTTEG